MALPPTFRARLVSRAEIAPSVVHLFWERVDGAPMTFEAGQWVNLVLPPKDGMPLRRAYSIASPPRGTPGFELAVTRVEGGPGSQVLWNLAPGAELDVVGPQGFFTRPLATASPSLFVGTGTGLTPLRSMILAAVEAGSTVPMTLLFGVRHEADLIFRNELQEAAAANPHLRVEFTLSREAPSWSGRTGYVQLHVRELYDALRTEGGPAPHVYVCGLKPMVDAVRELLKSDLALPRQLVHSERYD